MLAKIRRQEVLDTYNVFPTRNYNKETDEEEFVYPVVIKSYILTLPSRSFKGHVKMLGTELARMTQAIKENSLFFLGDTTSPWLYQQNDYRPVKEAQKYLFDNGIGKRFNGGVQTTITELPVFIKHLAWLTRCNAALPNIYFTDPGQRLLGHICQYGNLHLSSLNEKADKDLVLFIKSSQFEFGDTNSCYNSFSKSNRIPGRQIIM